jgi:hypothetical protein
MKKYYIVRRIAVNGSNDLLTCEIRPVGAFEYGTENLQEAIKCLEEVVRANPGQGWGLLTFEEPQVEVKLHLGEEQK